jgi:hypothetical protein
MRNTRAMTAYHPDRAIQLPPIPNLRGYSETAEQGMPPLTYETDACAVAPAVLRQVEVHIQQVLERFSRTHEPSREINGGFRVSRNRFH